MKTKTNEYYMQKALKQAQKAYFLDEVPIGAIVVDAQGAIIGQGYNAIEKKGCQTAHAEVSAIQKACKKIGDWRLSNCTLYSTLEPCLMCFGLIGLSRVGKIVYGAPSILFGPGLDNKDLFPLYKKNLKIESGVMHNECLAILQDFFKTKRGKKRGA